MYNGGVYSNPQEATEMLFRKHMDPRCVYCKYAASAEEGMVICRKKGIRPEGGKCRRFRYDPLRRVPPRPLNVDFSRYDSQDFTL